MEQVQLLKAAQQGHDEAFIKLITNHKIQLYRIAYSYFNNEQDALEAIQEVTYRAYKNIKKVNKPVYFSTWLIRIMINYCNDQLKKSKRELIKEPEDYEISHTEEKDKKILLEFAVKGLDPKLQEVILLKYFQDLTIDQIAEIMNRPAGTIKTWLNRALKSLRHELEKGDGFHA